MISVRKNADGCYEVMNGHSRLKVAIEVKGKAEVIDMATGKTLFVHEIDGNLIALSEDAQANLEDQAAALINRSQR